MALQLLNEDARFEVKDSDLDGIDGGDPETVYTVRQIPPHVNREIGRRHTTRPINRKTGTREEVVDWPSYIDDMVDYALVGWAGILHNGQPAPCDRQFKALLDGPRKAAILGLAGHNQRAGDRAESFRGPAPVL
jgi:hypothetical protein